MLRFVRHIPAAIAVLTGIAIPQFAHAQSGAAQEFFDIFVDLANAATPIIATIAVFSIVLIGVRMVGTTDDGALAKLKTTMAAIIAGLFVTLLAPNIVNIFYYDQVMSSGGQGLVFNQVRVRQELLGIAQWLQGLAVIIAVATIIVSGFRALVSFGDEGQVSAARRQVLYGIGGLLVIMFASTFFGIVNGGNTPAEWTLFDARTPNALIEFVFHYVYLILSFVLIVMVAILIFAGVMLIANFGDESRAEQVKGILIRAVTGLILIFFSVAIVRTVLWFFGAPS